METAAQVLSNCACAEAPAVLYWGELHSFVLNVPSAVSAAVAVGSKYLLTALCSGTVVAGKAGYAALSTALWPLAVALGWLACLAASHTLQIILAVALFIAWQIYFPSRYLIRLLSKLPYCRGVSFDFPPAPDKPSTKYVALTIDDSPCPYNTEAVLDTLKQAGAQATFFIIGSHVEKCDVMGVGSGRHGGEGHYCLGQETLRRMVVDGHELGNHTWHDYPSHKLPSKQLSNEIADVHRLISSARHAALTCSDSDSDSASASASAAPVPVAGTRSKWFRPGGGWFTPELVETAQKLGYQTVLGSVFPWDVFVKLPLLNALHVAAKVYPGAVIVLHDRRRHLLPTLKYVLPWLSQMGYEVVTLSEAAGRSKGGGPELTPAALDIHNQNSSSLSLASYSTSKSLDSYGNSNSYQQLHPAPANTSHAYLARMAKERERAALMAAEEEAERARLKALKRAEADRRAGIDRKLVDMSAAEKRAIERREREKKEAEIRRARRKVEEAKARVRYERYIKEKAEREAREAEERAEAEKKAREAEERRKAAQEEYEKRKEAERKYAAEMVARQRAEQAEREAVAKAAAAAAGQEIAAASEAGESSIMPDSVATSDQTERKAGKKQSLFKRLGSKAAKKLGVKEKSHSSTSTAAAAATAAAAVAAVGVAGAAASYATGTAGDSSTSAAAEDVEPVAAEALVPHETYGWYGLTPDPSSTAALASIDEAIAAYAAAAAAGEQLPLPVTGSYATGPYNRVLLGFDGRPLLLSKESPDSPDSPDGQAVLLDSQGQAVVGPGGEKIVMLLGAHGMPLADPHGRPVFVAEGEDGKLLGVHPDGNIIKVPASSVTLVNAGAITDAAAAAGVGPSVPEISSTPASAPASRRVSSSSAAAAEGVKEAAAAAAAGMMQQHSSSTSETGASIKEASSYAPSLARTSIRSNISGLAPAPTGTPAAAAAAQFGSTCTPSTTAAAHADPTPAAAAAAAAGPAMVPAQLLLGPSGKPLLGIDNRPLIVAVDDEGLPLVLGPEGQLLLGPDNRPLHLAYASDGSLVALDSWCRPLTGPDGHLRVVALDRDGRPMSDESGKAVLLALSPAGFVISDSTPPSARASWAGSPQDARLSSGDAAAALLAGSGAAGRSSSSLVHDADPGMTVVDAADYGAYSINAPAMAAAAAAIGAVGAAGVAYSAAAVAGSSADGSAANAPAAGSVWLGVIDNESDEVPTAAAAAARTAATDLPEYPAQFSTFEAAAAGAADAEPLPRELSFEQQVQQPGAFADSQGSGHPPTEDVRSLPLLTSAQQQGLEDQERSLHQDSSKATDQYVATDLGPWQGHDDPQGVHLQWQDQPSEEAPATALFQQTQQDSDDATFSPRQQGSAAVGAGAAAAAAGATAAIAAAAAGGSYPQQQEPISASAELHQVLMAEAPFSPRPVDPMPIMFHQLKPEAAAEAHHHGADCAPEVAAVAEEPFMWGQPAVQELLPDQLDQQRVPQAAGGKPGKAGEHQGVNLLASATGEPNPSSPLTSSPLTANGL